MVNAYQQKLQERADLLHITWTQAYRENKDTFELLAALTLEWSANDYQLGHIDGYIEGSLPWESDVMDGFIKFYPESMILEAIEKVKNEQK